MTSWRVLRLLIVILLVVLWFLVAWTSAVCQNPELSPALIAAGLTPEGLQFSMCLLDRWDYMMAVGKQVFCIPVPTMDVLKVPCHAFPVITRPLVCYVAFYA